MNFATLADINNGVNEITKPEIDQMAADIGSRKKIKAQRNYRGDYVGFKRLLRFPAV